MGFFDNTVLWLILIATLMVWDRIRFLTKVLRTLFI